MEKITMTETNSTTASRILGLVTLYNPDPDKAICNIQQYIHDIDQLIIWDNSALEVGLKDKILSVLHEETSKIIWYGDGKNYCIAPAINYSWHYAQDNNYDLILLMDQDSQWEDFHSFKTDVIELFRTSPNCVFCPYVINNDTFTITKTVQEKRVFINSGTVIPTHILNQIKGADLAFPLDALDHDIAIRIQKQGYSIVCLTKHMLHHTIGDPQIMGPFHLYTDNYGPDRIYSISKCHIIKYRKHKDWLTYAENKKTFSEHYFKKFIRILLAEPQKVKRLKMFFKGIYDGITFPIHDPR